MDVMYNTRNVLTCVHPLKPKLQETEAQKDLPRDPLHRPECEAAGRRGLENIAQRGAVRRENHAKMLTVGAFLNESLPDRRAVPKAGMCCVRCLKCRHARCDCRLVAELIAFAVCGGDRQDLDHNLAMPVRPGEHAPIVSSRTS